jgi:hypothetical protein
MDEKILQRISRQAGVADLAAVLAERLSASDLQSLLLEVFKRRAGTIAPRAVLNAYRENRFVRPSAVDPARFLGFDLLAYSLLPPGSQALELSPVSPLGSCSALAPVSQNNVFSALRGTEVVADSTSLLALECAVRRGDLLRRDPRSSERVKLAASHRQLRAQPFDDPKFSAHFRLFGLVTAGRDEGGFRFELDSLREHIGFYLAVLSKGLALKKQNRRAEVLLTDWTGERKDILTGGVLGPLAVEYPWASFAFAPERGTARSYYDRICFGIRLTAEDGSPGPPAYDTLVDGGFTDWTRRLLNNGKERLLTSGIGSELFLKL